MQLNPMGFDQTSDTQKNLQKGKNKSDSQVSNSDSQVPKQSIL